MKSSPLGQANAEMRSPANGPCHELMSAPFQCASLRWHDGPVLSLGGGDETAQIHHPSQRRGSRMAARGGRATTRSRAAARVMVSGATEADTEGQARVAALKL